VSDPAPAVARRRSLFPALVGLALLLLLSTAGWRAWQWRNARIEAAREHASETARQWQAIESRINALRTDQRAQAQRLQRADATNRVLREELLGLDQRAALLEDSVRRLGDPERHGVQALRLDEVVLLLGQGEQRVRLAGDLDGARRAYALAADVLAQVDSTRLGGAGLLNVRQSLVQERAALDALGADPRALASRQLDALAASLAATPPRPGTTAAPAPWWRRAFARLVAVRPVDRAVALPGADRVAAFAGLQLEVTLARAAVERRDQQAFGSALARADGWLLRLWPDSPELRRQRVRLLALRRLPLALDLPVLGTTRAQLRALTAR
jgi:uroporphyrin-3 C-methyltransferase